MGTPCPRGRLDLVGELARRIERVAVDLIGLEQVDPARDGEDDTMLNDCRRPPAGAGHRLSARDRLVDDDRCPTIRRQAKGDVCEVARGCGGGRVDLVVGRVDAAEIERTHAVGNCDRREGRRCRRAHRGCIAEPEVGHHDRQQAETYPLEMERTVRQFVERVEEDLAVAGGCLLHSADQPARERISPRDGDRVDVRQRVQWSRVAIGAVLLDDGQRAWTDQPEGPLITVGVGPRDHRAWHRSNCTAFEDLPPVGQDGPATEGRASASP